MECIIKCSVLHKVVGVTFCYDLPLTFSRGAYVHGEGHFTEHLDHWSIQKPKMLITGIFSYTSMLHQFRHIVSPAMWKLILGSVLDSRLTLSTTVGTPVTVPADTSIRHPSPVYTGSSVQAGPASTWVKRRGSCHWDCGKTMQFSDTWNTGWEV